MVSRTGIKSARPASLSLRVTMLVGVSTLLVFLAFSWLVARAMEQHFADQDAGELQAIAEAVLGVLAQRDREVGEDQLQQDLSAIGVGHHGIAYSVFDDAGRIVFRGVGPDLGPIARQQAPVQRIDSNNLAVWHLQGKTYRGVVLGTASRASSNNRDYRVVVAMDIDFHVAFLRSFKHMLWLSTALLASLAFLAAWLAVQLGHRPIRKVTEDIGAIRSSRLDARLDPLAVPVELRDLANSFNEMLGRIEEGFERLSNFSADIAHELRTPLTNLTIQTQVALSQPRSQEDYREALYSNLEEFERMGRMIGDMLFLAQTENDPKNLRLGPVRIDELVEVLTDYFGALAEEAGVELRAVGKTGPIQADRDMIMRAIGNLVSNAVRHAARGTSVTVRLRQDHGLTFISVENCGEIVPQEHLPKLFDRFYQVDPSRQRKNAGAGLGLAIAKSIVEAHGGTVAAFSTETLTRFELVLPQETRTHTTL
ncbi:heavy metal sensor histidine kinase [Variovorax dokdonensis]|uniref:Sensor protein n=1 Tax=Variovorax dokdonensis TaxID=344883 RepID=A0ABT7N7B0_9BURK|nr:heavy metal sensor histidine kinase [Variovorax dokdonensis]MDM0043765.1 heavy metal sensor histidine kinase [Variovorax dokdonensis]